MKFLIDAQLPVRLSHLRFPIPDMAGKGKTLGDIVSPIVDEEDWECLKW
ncbi:hypothetical protein [Pseudanabaena sp. Chao 1811]|nr:hypothetical protein [Pseudanabaena sp. Chao 1811]